MMQSSKPVVIGIAGGSGSGKTTFSKQLMDSLSDLKVQMISTDFYYRQPLPTMVSPVTGQEMEDWNSPGSFDLERLCADVARGMSAETGNDVLLVEGISVLYFPEIRDRMDLKVFVELDSDERLFRRIKRNMAWNLTLDEVGGYYLESAKHNESRHFLPTKVYADVIVNGYKLDGAAREMVVNWAKERLQRES